MIVTTGDVIEVAIATAVIGFVFGIAIASNNDRNIQMVDRAIAECQKELPRHKTCEVVITARVKQDG